MGMPDIQQLPPLIPSNVERQAVQEYQAATAQEKNQWDFEQKSKDTILFIGQTWGWTNLLLVIILGGVFRKRIITFLRTLTKKVV